MTDVTQHLGELMGRSDAEAALDLKGVGSTSVAQAQAPMSDAAQGVASATPAMADGATVANPLLHAADAAGASHAFDKYAFPFQSHEVFGLLPHSIGAKAEGLWQLAHTLAGDVSGFSLLVGGVLLGAVAVAAVSTARVWRRGEEFAVAGFGDRLTQVGSRYTVRQDAPVALFADKPGVVRRAEKSGPPTAPVIVPDPPELAAPAPTPEPAPAPAPTTWRARREAEENKRKAAKVERKAEKQPEPKPEKQADKKLERKAEKKADKRQERKAERKQTGWGKPKPEKAAAKPQQIQQNKARETPAVAAVETAPPKVVKRQLFKRSSTVTYAGSFHGSYGSFQQTDRLFARDYLQQTNDAFEAAYLKGKGPNLVDLKVGDNHRAERLFMMATRASFEDPQAALAALWQAVDEDRSDAVAWLRLAHFYLELGEFDHARRILEPLQSNGERLGLDIIVAASANSLGKIAAQRGELEGARKLFAKSLDHAQKTDNPFMLGVASSNSGLLEASRKKFDTAAGLLRRGIKGFEACDERVSAARSKLALGVIHACTGDDETAEQVWTEAVDAFRSAGFDDEASQVSAWLKGDGTPNAITL